MTVDHFREYAGLLILDTFRPWRPDDWQLDVARDLFEHREVWTLVPEGNGKTTLMAGVGLYHGDYTPEAMVALAAASREQAGRLLEQAIGFVQRSPGALARFLPRPGYRRVVCKRTGGLLQVFAADERTGDGLIYTLALLDELHRHRDLKLYRTWLGKADKRDGTLGVISTAGEPGGEFEVTVGELMDNGKTTDRGPAYTRVEHGETVVHRFGVPEGADVEDLELVKAANPLSTITVGNLRRKRARPGMTLEHWTRFTCNQATRGDNPAVSVAEWDAAYTDERPLEGEGVLVGIDLGWRWDTTAICPLWVPSRDFRVLLKPRIVVPPRDGTSTAPSRIHGKLLEVHREHPIHTVAMDLAAGAEQLAEWISSELGAKVVGYTNGTTEQARVATRWAESLRAEPPTLRHTGDETLRRHVLNAKAKMLPRGDVIYVRPVSSRSASMQDGRVIDALSAGTIVNDAAIAGSRARPFELSDYRIEAV
jgi:phage terminase large subunit-like protein